jgi:prepilin peptidase CpaA
LPGAISVSALVFFCVAAVYADIRFGKIPNFLNGIGLAGGLVLSVLIGGARGLAGSLAGSLLGLSILLVPFFLHMVGGGDVKFFAAGGALVGWRVLWLSFLAGAALGGIMGIVLLISRDGSLAHLRQRLVLLKAGIWRTPDALKRSPESGHREIRMPYALPLSLGLVLVACINLFG